MPAKGRWNADDIDCAMSKYEMVSSMYAYERRNAGDNSETISRLKRNLRLARKQALTARQAHMVALYYDKKMTMKEIGASLGVRTSTVSRTIARAKRRLEERLQYGL